MSQLARQIHLSSPDLPSKKQADIVARRLVSNLREILDAGGEVLIPGIGKLYRRDKPARTARNPRTGEMVEVPARSIIAFRRSKAAKAAP